MELENVTPKIDIGNIDFRKYKSPAQIEAAKKNIEKARAARKPGVKKPVQAPEPKGVDGRKFKSPAQIEAAKKNIVKARAAPKEKKPAPKPPKAARSEAQIAAAKRNAKVMQQKKAAKKEALIKKAAEENEKLKKQELFRKAYNREVNAREFSAPMKREYKEWKQTMPKRPKPAEIKELENSVGYKIQQAYRVDGDFKIIKKNEMVMFYFSGESTFDEWDQALRGVNFKIYKYVVATRYENDPFTKGDPLRIVLHDNFDRRRCIEALRKIAYSNSEDYKISRFQLYSSPKYYPKYKNVFAAANGNCVINALIEKLGNNSSRNTACKIKWLQSMDLPQGFSIYETSLVINNKYGFGFIFKDLTGRQIFELAAKNNAKTFTFLCNSFHAETHQHESENKKVVENIKIDDFIDSIYEWKKIMVPDVPAWDFETPEDQFPLVEREFRGPLKDVGPIKLVFREMNKNQVCMGARMLNKIVKFSVDQSVFCCPDNGPSKKPDCFTKFDEEVAEFKSKYDLDGPFNDPEIYDFCRAADYKYSSVFYGEGTKFLHYIDQNSAYPSYATCPEYELHGLPFRPFIKKLITDQNMQDEVLARSGISYIANAKANNTNLGRHIVKWRLIEGRLYWPHNLLAKLKKKGITFDIIATSYAPGKQDIDFKFGNCKSENNSKIGIITSSKNKTHFLVSNRDADYYEKVLGHVSLLNRDPDYFTGLTKIMTEQDRPGMTAQYHISAYIKAYQLMNMLDLMEVLDVDSCVGFKVDCIYFDKPVAQVLLPGGQEFLQRKGLFTESVTKELRKEFGTPKLFGSFKWGAKNVGLGADVSPTVQEPKDFSNWGPLDLEIEARTHQVVVYDGMAGAGKSTQLARLMKYYGKDNCYITTATNCLKENVRDKLFDKAETVYTKYNVNAFCKTPEMNSGPSIARWRGQDIHIFDDAGLIDSFTLNSIAQNLLRAGKMVILTMDVAQLTFCDEGDTRVQDLPFVKAAYRVELTEQYRMNEPLYRLAKLARGANHAQIRALIPQFNCIKMEDLPLYYTDLNDMIIAPTHDARAEINKYINDNLPKFAWDRTIVKIREIANTGGYTRGRISFVSREDYEIDKKEWAKREKIIQDNRKAENKTEFTEKELRNKQKYEATHTWTCHALQGLTCDGKVILDCRNKFFDPAIFYTAITRARTFDNVYLIV